MAEKGAHKCKNIVIFVSLILEEISLTFFSHHNHKICICLPSTFLLKADTGHKLGR